MIHLIQFKQNDELQVALLQSNGFGRIIRNYESILSLLLASNENGVLVEALIKSNLSDKIVSYHSLYDEGALLLPIIPKQNHLMLTSVSFKQ